MILFPLSGTTSKNSCRFPFDSIYCLKGSATSSTTSAIAFTASHLLLSVVAMVIPDLIEFCSNTLAQLLSILLDLTNIQNAYTKAASDAAARTASIISARSSLGNNLMYAVSCSILNNSKKSTSSCYVYYYKEILFNYTNYFGLDLIPA